MFAYCNNNPVNACDKNGKAPDTFAGWIGEEIGKFIYELITGEDHPSREAERTEAETTQKQNEMIQGGAKALWDACMRGYNIQREAQLMETQAAVDLFSTPDTAAKTLNAVGTELVFIGCFWGGTLLTPIGSGMLFVAAILAFA